MNKRLNFPVISTFLNLSRSPLLPHLLPEPCCLPHYCSRRSLRASTEPGKRPTLCGELITSSASNFNFETTYFISTRDLICTRRAVFTWYRRFKLRYINSRINRDQWRLLFAFIPYRATWGIAPPMMTTSGMSDSTRLHQNFFLACWYKSLP